MPTVDRYWWLELLVALPLAALAVALSMWLMSAQSAGAGAQGYVIAIVMLLLLLALALILALKSVPMRHRTQARTRAIRGMSDSIPLSTVVPDDGGLPDLTVGALILEWRATRAGRATLHWALLCLNLLLAVGGLLVAALPHGDAPGGLPIGWPPKSGDLTIAGWLLIIPVSIGIYLVLRGRRAAVVATEEGVTRKPIIGRMKTVWWEDARLLEVTGSGRDVYRTRRYTLYGPRSVVWWDERLAPGSMLTWDGVEASDGEKRSQELVGAIHARTGLAPRTFVRWLQQRPESKGQGQVALGDALLYALLAVGAGGIAAALLLVPFSKATVVNAVVAAPFGAFAAVFLGQTLRRLADFAGRDALSHWELLRAPTNLPPTSPDGTYSFSYATPWLRRAFALLSGALLTVELLPVWFLDVMSPVNPGRSVFPAHPALGPLGSMLACMLIPFGIAGTILVVAALRSGQRTITANAFGLELQIRSRKTIIDWYEVDALIAIVHNGRVMGYRVTRRPQETEPSVQSIYWPTVSASAGTESAITGDELAALVAERMGKLIQVR